MITFTTLLAVGELLAQGGFSGPITLVIPFKHFQELCSDGSALRKPGTQKPAVISELEILTCVGPMRVFPSADFDVPEHK